MPPEPVTLQQLSSAIATESASPDGTHPWRNFSLLIPLVVADRSSSTPFRMTLSELMKVRDDFFTIQRHIYKTQDLVELASARVLEVIELLDEAIEVQSSPSSSPVSEMLMDEPEHCDEEAQDLR